MKQEMTVTMTHSSKMDSACAGHLALRARVIMALRKNHRKSGYVLRAVGSGKSQETVKRQNVEMSARVTN